MIFGKAGKGEKMKHRILTVTVKPGDNPGHPLIFLGGKWLKECGFEIGGKVLIECKHGALNIRAIRFVGQEEDNTPLAPLDRGEKEEREVILNANNS
jgi:hypothetical protein